MSSILIRTAVIVLLLAVLGLGTGLLFGAGWGWSLFSLGLAGLLVHHVRHLGLLRQWASRSLTETVPEGTGAWEEVFTLLYRRQRAETARNRQLAHSLARSRQAGRALPYGVAILDAEYRIVWCNDSCEAHFRHRRRSRCRPADHQPRASAGIRRVRRGRRVLQAPSADDDAGRPRPLRPIRSLRRLAAAAAFARHHAGHAPGDHAPGLRRERFARAAHPAHRAGGVPGNGAGTQARSGTLARLPEHHGRAKPAHAAHHRRPADAVHARIGAGAAAR